MHSSRWHWSARAGADSRRGSARTGCGGPASTGGSGSHGAVPRPPVAVYLQRSALALKGLSYAPDRCAARRGDHVAAGDPGRRTELGLPLHLDPRLDLRPVGPVHPRLRPRGQRLLLLHPRRLPGQPNDLQIMYGVGGERHSTEGTLDHLTGYDDARPVRIGNGAYNQQQHDVWGALLDSIYLHTRSREQHARGAVADRHRAGRAGRRALASAGPRHLGGARRAAALHRRRRSCAGSRWTAGCGWPGCTTRTRSPTSGRRSPTRSTPTSCANGVDERGVLVQRYGSDALDASLLLAPLVRFLPPDDPRIRATVLAIADELTPTGWCCATGWRRPTTGWPARRAPSPSARSGWCRRWWRSARSSGRSALCERLLSLRLRSGCTPRSSTRDSGRHLGNFPQAFTHLALINAVLHVMRAQAGDESLALGFLRPLAG